MTQQRNEQTETNQGKILSRRATKSSEKFFVNGYQNHELEGRRGFHYDGKDIDCYTDSLYDNVNLVFDQLDDFIRLMDETKEDPGILPMRNILDGLSDHGRATIMKWIDDAEQHMGALALRRVCNARGGVHFASHEAIAGEMIFYKEVSNEQE